jgi:pimeloyl-ACP methyl ester carboxylesterase
MPPWRSTSSSLTFDKRGTGLSDPVPASDLPSIEEWMDDLRTVMDENGIDRAVLVANLASSFMAMVFAATYPTRVRALVMVNAYPRFTRADDYPWGFDGGNFDMVMERTRRTWGKGMLLRQLGVHTGEVEVVGDRGPGHRCPHRCPCVGPRGRERGPRQLDGARPGGRAGPAIRGPWFPRAQRCAGPMAGSGAH